MGEMSKVEEVALAMFKELSRQHPELSKGDGFGYAEAGYYSADEGLTILDGAYDLKAVARAAIEALRVPTPRMKKSALFHSISTSNAGDDSFDYVSEDDAGDIFETMIDAALKE